MSVVASVRPFWLNLGYHLLLAVGPAVNKVCHAGHAPRVAHLLRADVLHSPAPVSVTGGIVRATGGRQGQGYVVLPSINTAISSDVNWILHNKK
jgi:hypothetical protein